MIKCENCGKEYSESLDLCPECAKESELKAEEAERLLKQAEELLNSNDFIGAVDIYKFLAGAGVVAGERALALILERGVLLPRDLDAAIKYYYSAAQKGDPISAYRYAKLIVGNEERADFWLAFAAIMEYREAYADAYALYSRHRERGTAAYYCSQLAEDGDDDALIEMARRHLYGDGVEQNERQAKWYIERIERTPIHALKLYRRIQAVEGRSVRPKIPTFTDRNRIMQRLMEGAKSLGYHKVLLIICEKYRELGAKDADVFLAKLHIEGIEFPANVELGISILENAMTDGCVLAATTLGDLYREGEYVEQSDKTATYYYRLAAKLGGEGYYEKLGDIFHDGILTDPDYALVLSLYQKGAEDGDLACRRKLAAMYEERERNYVEASRLERTNPEEAFPLFKLSVDAGYLPAHARIGWYYERGIGTKVDRKAAYTHYKAAYDAGDKRAIESLGRCYARGIGVAFDFDKASELLQTAREMGSHSADRELFRIYENKKKHMLRSLYSTAMRLYYNKKYDIARSMLETCMQLGLPDATYAIGCLYEFGITTAPDRKIALRFYKKAYEQGYSDPRQYHKQSMLRISR